MDDKKYREILNECANDDNMENDTFQYGIMKVLRSVNNISDTNELFKYKSVINYLGAVLKESVYCADFVDIKNRLNYAISITTDKNLVVNKQAVQNAWMKLYIKSCEVINPHKGNGADAARNVGSKAIDSGINIIINGCNQGKYEGIIWGLDQKGEPAIIYNDATRKYNATIDSTDPSNRFNDHNSYIDI